MSNPIQQKHPNAPLSDMEVENIETDLNLNFDEFNDENPIQQELFLNSRQMSETHKPINNYNIGQSAQFYLPQEV